MTNITRATISTCLGAVAITGVLALSGCGDKPREDARTPTVNADEWPDWAKDPTKGGSIVGALGIGKKSLSGQSFQYQTAQEDGRRNLAASLESKVQSVWKDWVREGGEITTQETRTTAMEMRERISRSVTNQVLKGVMPKNTWTDKSTGDLFIWMVMDKAALDAFGKQIVDNTKKEMEARKAHFASKIEAEKAYAELDKLVDKELGLSGDVPKK